MSGSLRRCSVSKVSRVSSVRIHPTGEGKGTTAGVFAARYWLSILSRAVRGRGRPAFPRLVVAFQLLMRCIVLEQCSMYWARPAVRDIWKAIAFEKSATSVHLNGPFVSLFVRCPAGMGNIWALDWQATALRSKWSRTFAVLLSRVLSHKVFRGEDSRMRGVSRENASW